MCPRHSVALLTKSLGILPTTISVCASRLINRFDGPAYTTQISRPLRAKMNDVSRWFKPLRSLPAAHSASKAKMLRTTVPVKRRNRDGYSSKQYMQPSSPCRGSPRRDPLVMGSPLAGDKPDPVLATFLGELRLSGLCGIGRQIIGKRDVR